MRLSELGYTLVELMTATAIVLVLSTAVFMGYRALAAPAVAVHMEIQKKADVLEKMSRECLLAPFGDPCNSLMDKLRDVPLKETP